MTQFSHRALPAPESGGIDPLETALHETSAPAQGGGASGPPKQNALAAVHRIFRGRYHWLVILGLIFGGTGGYLGFRKGKQIYTCAGSIRINYYIPVIGSGTGDTTGAGVQQGYDIFVNQQMQAILSKRVMEEAVKDPQWKGLVNIEDEGLAVMDLVRRIKVSQKSDQVVVESSDVNAAQATAAVNAVVAAYKKLYVPVDWERTDQVMNGLLDTQKLTNAEVDTLRRKLNDKVKEAGSDNLDADYTSKHDQLVPIEGEIQRLTTQIAVAQLDLQKKPLDGITDEMLMVMDKELRDLSQLLTAAESQVTRVKSGKGSANPKALDDAMAEVADLNFRIGHRVAQIHDLVAAGFAVDGLPRPHTENDIKILQAQIDVLTPRAEKLRGELVAIGGTNNDLKDLRSELKELESKQAATRETIEQRRINNPTQRRIEVLSEGEFPLAPDRDSRPKLAAAGGAAGMLFATVGVALLGLTSTRLRAPHDLQIRLESQPVLGVIPSLDAGADFQARAALASECVHRSRTMLEIWGRGTKKMVIGVTSPTHGSGNTSVAMSLGVSFAAAGLKTLLVDCDFVTTGLTPRLQTLVRREIGVVLQRTGLLTDVQLNHARRVHAAEETNGALGQRSLGEVCVELNYITRAELDAALAVQGKESIGILDVLQGEDLLSCVGKTGIRNLSMLPRANATPAHAAKLSSQSLRQILDNAREHFDTVIIDTSAMLSGLEASIVASAVDGMVVTVKRGEERSKLQKTLARLKALECPVAGIIFNHVLPGDMPTPAPLEGASIDHDTLLNEKMNLDLAGRLAELGPLASSVVSRVPVSELGTELG